MSIPVFPDNTVLCNFAAVGRLDLLEGWLRGRGRWCEAVAHEARQSSGVWPTLASLFSEGWLGEPIEVDDQAAGAIERLRRVALGGDPARPTQHLGEAQTCWVIREVGEFAGAWWVSDDRDALDYARVKGIQTYRTVDAMRAIVADGDLTPDRAHRLMLDMTAAGRAIWVPASARELA